MAIVATALEHGDESKPINLPFKKGEHTSIKKLF